VDNRLVENWQEYSKTALAASKELETINTQVIEKLTGKQMELANTAFETGTRYMATLSEIKDYPGFVAEQSKIVAEFNETFIEAARSSADLMSSAREAYQSWFEQGFKRVVDGSTFDIPGAAQPAKAANKKAA
jgi:hypothetical protein